MKKLFFNILLISVSSICHAQLNIGLKLNWTINKFVISNPAANEEFYNDGIYGGINSFTLSGGMMANYKFNKRFSFQSELIYNSIYTGFGKVESYTNSQGDMDYAGNDFMVQLHYLEIPLLAKVSFGQKVTFDILGGAYVGYLLSAKQSTGNGTLMIPVDTIYQPGNYSESKTTDYPKQSVRSDYTSLNAGVLVGVGITMHDKVIFEMRLSRGLVNINKTGSAKMNTLQAQFTVGYYLFRQKKKG